MAKRHKRWASRQRQLMIAAMGGACAACGSTEALTFDCIAPRGDSHHRGNAVERMTFYRREARAGNIQVLCDKCNALKGDTEPSLWLVALAMSLSDEVHQSATGTPGGGTAWTIARRRESIQRSLELLY
jgi:hypothetical protein